MQTDIYEPTRPASPAVDQIATPGANRGGLRAHRLTRRQALQIGLLAGAAAVTPFAVGCSGDAAATQTASLTRLGASLAGRSSLNAKAHEAGNLFLVDVDWLALSAGSVAINFTNTGTIRHELYLYPPQDVSGFLRRDPSSTGPADSRPLANLAAGFASTPPGVTGTEAPTLAPGFYELACYLVGNNSDGTPYVHFDRGETATIAVPGPGGPSADVVVAANALNVQAVPGQAGVAGSWLFVPDRLVVRAGSVAFTVSNRLSESHSFAVFPLADLTALTAQLLAGGATAPNPSAYRSIQAQVLPGTIPPGHTTTGKVELTAGWWAAACLEVGRDASGHSFLHRDKGERFTFLVI